MTNIVYKTDKLVQYFAHNRVKWEQFYESERKLIEQLQLNNNQTVLDIGCGCGGLGLALRERFSIENYNGVEINALAAEAGKKMNPDAKILSGDILNLSQNVLLNKQFDVVFSLSCIDWNVRFSDMLAAAWEHVKPGGYFVATFRLTNEKGCNDINKSYQYINYEENKEGELASYVVLNAESLLQELNMFNPSEIRAYGYWGAPSVTAITPYEQLCFAAFSIQKRNCDDKEKVCYHLQLPDEFLSAKY
jgi:SAM-dependent methyltransferase